MYNRLYTDGSCIGNPGRGGWAAKCLGFFEISGYEVLDIMAELADDIDSPDDSSVTSSATSSDSLGASLTSSSAKET